MGHILCRYVW